MACLYLNAVVGAFAHILNPSIQADIRDYQQYKTGERIDGMFEQLLQWVVSLLLQQVYSRLFKKNTV